MRKWIRNGVTIATVLAALMVWMVAPASAKNGATQIGGSGFVVAVFDFETGEPAFTEDCPAPDGESPIDDTPYSDFGDLTIQLVAGNLQGCWYTLVEEATASPSFDASPLVYHERGREVFVGTWYADDGTMLGSGTFETSYRFTGKYEDASFAVEIHGRCQHPLVAGTGTGVFDGMRGRVDFKDNVETGELTYRGHLK